MRKMLTPGTIFGKLTVLEFDRCDSKHGVFWKCKCACGKEVSIQGSRMRLGKTKSCGCNKITANTKHGKVKTREYICWTGIKRRCLNKNDKGYITGYGGKGVRICDRWRDSFDNFLSDMGPKPTPQHSIERIDSNGHYEPDNCRWATPKEQSNNTKRNRKLTFNGETLNVSQWAERIGMDPDTLLNRLQKSWSVERAITTPIRKMKPFIRKSGLSR